MPYYAYMSSDYPHLLPGWSPEIDAARAAIPDARERSRLSSVFSSGYRPAAPDEVPKTVILETDKSDVPYPPPNVLPPGFEASNRIVLVSAAVRDVIEAHDPGRHQFFPVEVRLDSGGLATTDPYFVMVVWERHDASAGGPPPGLFALRQGMEPLRIDPLRMPDLHLWRMDAPTGGFVLSDALHDALAAKGLMFFETKRAEMAQLPN